MRLYGWLWNGYDMINVPEGMKFTHHPSEYCDVVQHRLMLCLEAKETLSYIQNYRTIPPFRNEEYCVSAATCKEVSPKVVGWNFGDCIIDVKTQESLSIPTILRSSLLHQWNLPLSLSFPPVFYEVWLDEFMMVYISIMREVSLFLS